MDWFGYLCVGSCFAIGFCGLLLLVAVACWCTCLCLVGVWGLVLVRICGLRLLCGLLGSG